MWFLIFGAALLVTAYYVFALLFHWIKYGTTMPLVWLALPIYLAGTAFLILISLFALISLI